MTCYYFLPHRCHTKVVKNQGLGRGAAAHSTSRFRSSRSATASFLAQYNSGTGPISDTTIPSRLPQGPSMLTAQYIPRTQSAFFPSAQQCLGMWIQSRNGSTLVMVLWSHWCESWGCDCGSGFRIVILGSRWKAMCLFWEAITGCTGEVSGYCKQVSCIPAAMPGSSRRIQRRQAHFSLVGGKGRAMHSSCRLIPCFF